MAGVHASTPAALDTTAPAAPSQFFADLVGADVALSWVNPTEPDLNKVVVRRRQGTPPALVTDGAAVFTTTVGTTDMRSPFACGQYAGNMQIRYPRDRGIYRFVADQTGTLVNFHVKGKLHASEVGYAGSPTGGTDTGVMDATLYRMDTDGGPDIAFGALAHVNFTIASQEPTTTPFRGVLTLNFNVALTAGQAYVIVYYNADPRNCDAGATNTINGALDAVTTTVVLTNARAEYVNGGCITLTNTELCIITAGGGTTTLTVQRGQYGTTATTHLNGANVQGASPFYFSTNFLYYARPFGSGLVGSWGALARNQVAAGATDNYYNFDGRTVLGASHDSASSWYIPSSVGAGNGPNRHHIPTYLCEWGNGSVTGQPYYSGHSLPAGTYRMYFKNITADWTITQIGAFCPDDLEFATNASTPVLVYVNDVLVDTVLLGGVQGFLRAWLTAPITLHAGDVLKLQTTADPTGVAGLKIQSQYSDTFFADLVGSGNNSTYPYYAEPADLDAGGAERVITLYPMPDRGRTPVIHETTTTDPGSAGWAYSAFAYDTAGNVSAPAILGTTTTLVGGNLAASPGWATPGWFTLGGVGGVATGAVSSVFTFGSSVSGLVIYNPIEEGNFYATVSELARILKIREPSVDQEEAMLRVLETATLEIDSELDRDDGSYEQPFPSLVVQVCLERATEHWRQQESPFGLIAIGVDVPAERSASNSWERHALKLAPLKEQWGLA